MPDPSFGFVHDMTTLDPTALVDMSYIPQGAFVLAQSVVNDVIKKDINTTFSITPLIAFVSDVDGDREFAVIDRAGFGPYYFDVYDVITGPGAPWINHSSSTLFDHSETINYIFGIRKAAGLYYVYYGSVDSLVTPTYYRLWVVEVDPGVTSTETLVQQITLDQTNCKWAVASIRTIEQVGYIGLVQRFPDTGSVASFKLYIYTLDIDTEAVGGGFVFNCPGKASQVGYFDPFTIVESMGAAHWVACYHIPNYQDPPIPSSSSCHVVVDGIDTEVCTYSEITSNVDASSQLNNPKQYNSRDWLVEVVFFGPSGDPATMQQTLVATGALTTRPYVVLDNYIVPPFNSQTVFPAVCYVAGGVQEYHYVNIADNMDWGLITVPGVAHIYSIFPTLDTTDDSIYMYVQMNDSSFRLIGVDPGTFTITRTLNVEFHATYRTFNLGNFFIRWDTELYVTYFLPTSVVPNEINMIPEMN
jgi:hypothetical protein